MLTRILAGNAVLAVLLATSSASAQGALGNVFQQSDSRDSWSYVRVQYSDLDVRGDAGANAMLGRLDAAAQRVCGPADRVDLRMHAVYQRCMHETMERAVRETRSPLVEAKYDGEPMPLAENTYQPVTRVSYRHSALSHHRHMRHSAHHRTRHPQ